MNELSKTGVQVDPKYLGEEPTLIYMRGTINNKGQAGTAFFKDPKSEIPLTFHFNSGQGLPDVSYLNPDIENEGFEYVQQNPPMVITSSGAEMSEYANSPSSTRNSLCEVIDEIQKQDLVIF